MLCDLCPHIGSVLMKVAPVRFECSCSLDHAEYLIVDPGGINDTAILGSPNAIADAFDGCNLDDAVETRSVGGY